MIARMERERSCALQIVDLVAYAVSCASIEGIHLFRVAHTSEGSAPRQSVLLLLAGVGVLWSISLAIMGAYRYPVVFRREVFALIGGGALSCGIVLALTPGGWLSIP